ncbi:MAG: hypothetical protein ACOWWO_01705 [Peptococcaceae bacterium]
MGHMTLKEIHERLMLYKMVRQVVAQGNNDRLSQSKESPWLCNVYEGNKDNLLH